MRRAACAAVLAAMAALAPSSAQAQSNPRLPELTIEELLGVKVAPVFGASERLQPVTEAPASVTIITADEIRRYGYRTLADILRGTRGFFVTNDRNYSYVGVLGFNQPGDYNTRILLLINGQKVNDNVYDQAYIGAELGLDAEMFERVEIIRGPSSSVYGTSAFFGVVNVITRSAASLDGLTLGLDVGDRGTVMTRASFGREFGNGLALSAAAAFERTDGAERLYFQSFDDPATNHGIAQGLDGERVSGLFAHASWRDFSLTVADGLRHKDVPTASFSTLFNYQEAPEHTRDRHTMIGASFGRAIGRTRLTINAAFDRLKYEGRYPFAGESFGSSRPVVINRDYALGSRWGLHTRATRDLPGRQTLTAGGEFYHNFTQRQGATYDDPALTGFVSDRSSLQGAVFVQDDVRVRPWLLLSGGLRHDWYVRFTRTTPRLAVILLPGPNTSVKAIYGVGFRAPNAYELYYYEDSDAPERLRPETTSVWGLTWEQYVGTWLRTAASIYRADATSIITLARIADTPYGFSFVNRTGGAANGISGEAEIQLPGGGRFLANLSQHRSRDARGGRLPNSPDHTGAMRVSIPLGVPSHTAALELQYVGARPTLSGLRIGASRRLHATYAGRVSRGFEIIATVRNLLDARVFDPSSSEHLQPAIEQDGRTVRIGVRWTVGASR